MSERRPLPRSRIWRRRFLGRALGFGLRILGKTLRVEISAVTPDGPRGPARVASPNIVQIARRAGCALRPVGAASQGWRLKTWDGLHVPKPFARAALCIGAPLQFDESANMDDHAKKLG